MNARYEQRKRSMQAPEVTSVNGRYFLIDKKSSNFNIINMISSAKLPAPCEGYPRPMTFLFHPNRNAAYD